MGKLYLGWREWCLAGLTILDCFNYLLPFIASLFVFEYLMTTLFKHIMFILLIIHYSVDGFRWQLYPLYIQLICSLCSSGPFSSVIPSTPRLSSVIPASDILDSTTKSLLQKSIETHLPTSTSFAASWSPRLSIFSFPAVEFALRVLSLLKLPFVCISFFLCWVFPLPSFPEPDGSWGVGLEAFDFLCSVVHQQLNTPDELSSLSESSPRLSPRLFQALVFYPIEKHRHKNEGYFRWLENRSTHGLSRMLGLPRFLFKYLLHLETHSVMLAPLSKKRRKYPVAFLSHGLGMIKTSHSLLCQALASHGYIVVSIEHTDGSAVVTTSLTSSPKWFYGSISFWQRSILPLFSKNRLFPTSPTASSPSTTRSSTNTSSFSNRFRDIGTTDANKQLRNDLQALAELMSFEDELIERRKSDATTDDEKQEAQSREQEYRHAQLKIRCSELLAAYDAMVQMSHTSGSPFKDRVDWDASSVIGFGFGGAAALLACLVDYVKKQNPSERLRAPMFKSCVLLCSWMDALNESELKLSQWLKDIRQTSEEPAPARLPQNFMIINTTEQVNQKLTNQIRLIKLLKDAVGEKIILQFYRCKRLDFTDIPIIAPHVFRYLKLSGPRSPDKTAQMVNHVVCNFLSHHYRRSLFRVTPGLVSRDGDGPSRRKSYRRPTVLLSAGSESETASGFLSVGSISDHSVSSVAVSSDIRSISRLKSSLSCAQFRTRYAPSLLQALRLAGIPDQYIRGLGGLRTPTMAKELGRQLQAPEKEGDVVSPHAFYDVLEGVVEFVDDKDCLISNYDPVTSDIGNLNNGIPPIHLNRTVAEICHI